MSPASTATEPFPSSYTVHCADALAHLRAMPGASVNLILVDPPYFRVKGVGWDNAWDDAAAFLAWMGELADEWWRVLAPNGSLYCFASPQMAARVECVIAARFDVLNSLVWVKPNGNTNERCSREGLRSYLTNTERIIFAQQRQTSASFGEYIRQERERAGVSRSDLEVRLGYVLKSNPARGSSLCYRWEEGSSIPTADAYRRMRAALGEDYLRREYEDLRRPFAVTADVPHREVWTFPAPTHRGRHICEKPVPMLEHIISTSSRPGDVVLDCFAGSGSAGEAALRLGRTFIGVELDPVWADKATARLDAVAARPNTAGKQAAKKSTAQKKASPPVAGQCLLDFG